MTDELECGISSVSTPLPFHPRAHPLPMEKPPPDPEEHADEGAGPEKPYPISKRPPPQVREPALDAYPRPAKRAAGSRAERWMLRGPRTQPGPPAEPARYPLHEFREAVMEHLELLRGSGEAAVLTLDGEPALVVQAADAYQRLLDRLEDAETALGIREGLDSVQRGEGRPVADVLHEMRAKYGPDRPR